MSKVYVRKAEYDYAVVKPIVRFFLDSIVGAGDVKGKSVLIKPNFLCPAKIEQAILTHPFIIKAVVEYVLEEGGRPQVSDSNAVGAFDKIVKSGGIEQALAGLNVDLRPLKDSVKVETGDAIIKTIELSRDVLEADMLINLPKLKTHSQMMMTLGVKNLFGCVVGLRKPEWHLRVGVDRELFARLLVIIHKKINPAVTILDGILAMEGEGPGTSGTPRRVGALCASSSAFALDRAVAKIVGIDEDAVVTNKMAKQMGIDDAPEIEGEYPVLEGYKLPDQTETMFGPRRFMGFMRRHTVRRPVADNKHCKLCGECWKYCPAKAITPSKKRLVFDYDKCIRCYCCLEVCPHGALSTHEPIAGKLLKRLKPD